MKAAYPILLITALVGEIWLATLLVRHAVQRRFPFFFAYVVYSVLASAAQLLTASHYKVYFLIFWTNEAVLAILSILTLLEVFRWVFVLFWLLRWFRLSFYTILALVLLVPITNAILKPPIHVPPLVAAILSAGIVVNFLQGTICMVFWLLVRFFDIGFRRFAFGIMLGFGPLSCGKLIAWIFRSEFGTRFTLLGIYLPPVAYLLALAFWLVVFSRPEPPEPEWQLPITPQQLLEQIKQYTGIVKKF
jgi:hypothetical protein